jgi:hypothetical protein
VWDLCSGDDDGIDEVSFFESAFTTWAAENEFEEPAPAEPTSYTVTFSPDYVKCYIGDEESDHQAEFRGKLTIDGSNLWYVSGDDGHSHWDCSEGDWVTTSTIGYVDSSSRYSEVSRTFTTSELNNELTLRVNWLTEDDSTIDDTFSVESETYHVDSVVSWDGLHWVIVSEDGDNKVKFYVLIEVTENY